MTSAIAVNQIFTGGMMISWVLPLDFHLWYDDFRLALIMTFALDWASMYQGSRIPNPVIRVIHPLISRDSVMAQTVEISLAPSQTARRKAADSLLTLNFSACLIGQP